MRNLSLWLIAATAACGAANHAPRAPLSARQHYDEARRHEADAARHEQTAAIEGRSTDDVYCANRTVVEQSTSGGVAISRVTPCWTSRTSQRDAELHRAASLRRDANRHRTIAAHLIEAERAACDPLPVAERDHSPSWHRDDVLAVEPVRDGGPVVGATLVFRKVAGMSVDWLRMAYTCHQAQAAAEGYDPTFMTYCPAGLPDVTIEVGERTDGFVVTLRSTRADIAAAILGRATDLRED